MSTNTSSEEMKFDRRRFLGAAVISVAAVQLGIIGSARAESKKARSPETSKTRTNTSFVSLKQFDAGLLNVGYAEAWAIRWPRGDSSAWLAVRHLQLCRCRAFARRERLSSDRSVSARLWHDPFSFRRDSSQRPAVGRGSLNIIALLDALKIDKPIIAGFDWGARTADIIAALWPERCKGLVSVSGYLIGSQASGKNPLPPQAEFQWWYQYYFATDRGRNGYDKYRKDFAKLIWPTASPKWHFDEATFDRSAASFDNPDHLDIVIHNYRWRLGLAEGEAKYDDLEKRLAEAPVISVPTITLEGDANGAPHPDPSSYAKKFVGKYEHRTIQGGVGHNLPQEAPQAFAKAVVDVDRF